MQFPLALQSAALLLALVQVVSASPRPIVTPRANRVSNYDKAVKSAESQLQGHPKYCLSLLGTETPARTTTTAYKTTTTRVPAATVTSYKTITHVENETIQETYTEIASVTETDYAYNTIETDTATYTETDYVVATASADADYDDRRRDISHERRKGPFSITGYSPQVLTDACLLVIFGKTAYNPVTQTDYVTGESTRVATKGMCTDHANAVTKQPPTSTVKAITKVTQTNYVTDDYTITDDVFIATEVLTEMATATDSIIYTVFETVAATFFDD